MNTLADLPLRRKQTEAWLDLHRIGRAMDVRAASLFAEFGITDITPTQASVLIVLFQAREPISSRRVADALGVSEATVCHLVEKLERGGWILRAPCPDDARRRLVRPTEKAYDTLPRFIRTSNALLDVAYAGIEREGVEQLTDMVKKLRENLGG